MASCIAVETESVQRVKRLVEKKLKSLIKQKTKLELYKADQDACKGLSSAEAAAVVHYDCVVRCMEIANELSKQFIDILGNHNKQIEKIKKQEKQKYMKNEKEKNINKVKEILKIQSVLQQLGSEQVRRDFLAGAKGAILLYHQQLGQIHNLFRMVTPATKDKLPDDQKQNEHLESATSHLLSLVNEQDTEVVGTTHKELYSLIQKIYNSPYRKNTSNLPKNSKNLSKEDDTSRESSSSIVEKTGEILPKVNHTSQITASSLGTNLNKNKSSNNRFSTICNEEFNSKNNYMSQMGKTEAKETSTEKEPFSVNQLRQQLIDTEERLHDMERTHGTMSAKLSALTQAQANPTLKLKQHYGDKLKQHYGDISAQCQNCNESFKVLEKKIVDEVQLRYDLSEMDDAREKLVNDLAMIVKEKDSLTMTIDSQAQDREKAANDLAMIVKEKDSLTVTIDSQAQDIAQTQSQLQEMLTKKIVLESRLSTLEKELISVRQELSNQNTKKETLDVFHRILVVGDERIPQLSFNKPDTLQIYSKPGLKLDNILSFMKECNICPVKSVDTLVIVSVGINDIMEMAPVENCRTMNHDPLMVCPNYNALVSSAKIITDKIYSVYTDLKDFIRGVVHFTPVLPVDLLHYQELLLREHKENTGHSVIVYNSLVNRNLVNTKVNDIISEVNTHVQLFIGEGRHDWEIFNNTEGMLTSQFLSNGFYPSDDSLKIMVNKLKVIQKKHTYNEKMDNSISKLVISSIERKTCRKESLKDWGLKEVENSLNSTKNIRSSNYLRNKKYSMRHHSRHLRNDEGHSKKEFRRSERSRSHSVSRSRSRSRDRGNDEEWHEPGRCVSPPDWHHPEVCRKKELLRSGIHPDSKKYVPHYNSPNIFKDSARSPNPRSRERSKIPSESRSRSRSPDRSNHRRWSRSPDRRRKEKSRSGSSRRSNSPTSSRSRSATPEDSKEMYHSLLKTFKDIIDALDQDYKNYIGNPSTHPEYNNEYGKFYESKSRTISNIGGDVSKYDFSVDWQALWPRRMNDLYKDSKNKLEKQFLSGLSSKDKKYFKKRIRDYNSPSICRDETTKNKFSEETIHVSREGNLKLPFELVHEDEEKFKENEEEILQKNYKEKIQEKEEEKLKIKFKIQKQQHEIEEKEEDDDGNETLTNEDMGLQEVGDEVDDFTMPLVLNQDKFDEVHSKENLEVEDEDDQPLYPMIPLQLGKFRNCSLSSDNENSRTPESPLVPLLPPPPPPPILSLPTAEQIFRDLKTKPVSEQVEMLTNINLSSVNNNRKEALQMLLKDIELNDSGLALAIAALMN